MILLQICVESSFVVKKIKPIYITNEGAPIFQHTLIHFIYCRLCFHRLCDQSQ